MNEPQARIGPYTILRKLGAGGMGIIFLAEDPTLRRKVALKVLNAQHDPARFLNEARSAAALNHPNIATIFHVGEAESDVTVTAGSLTPVTVNRGTPYLAMELIEGEALSDRLRERGPLPQAEIVDTAIQMAEGLAEAHAHGIVHRDLKPANVMRTTAGRIKILDFGLAKAVPTVAAEGATQLLEGIQQLTQEGHVVGTPAYMSPEQATGQEVDARTDVFAFGVILTEMATGSPTQDKLPLWIVATRPGLAPVPLSAVRQDLDPAIGAVRDRCLDPDPGVRFRNAGELVTALRALQSSQVGQRTMVLPASEMQTVEVPGSALGEGAGGPAPEARPWFRSRRVWAVAAVAALGAAALLYRVVPRHAGGEVPTLAVFPFSNQGPPDREFVVQGITEEVTTRLASLHGLNVVASTSTLPYKGSDKKPSAICRELGADYLLQGSVTWSRDSVQVTPRLIRSGEDSYFWVGEPMTAGAGMDATFALQSKIAELAAEQIDEALVEPLRKQQGPPTQNREAYDAYLRGVDAGRRYSEDYTRRAIADLEQAVSLDPDFALAHARLSIAHAWMVRAGYSLSKERKALARTEAEKALALDPDLPEATLAMGYVWYWADNDPKRALTEFSKVRKAMPNNSNLLLALGAVHRRRGEFGEALPEFQRAADLDPRSPSKAWEVGETLRFLRRFPEAETWYERCLNLDPDDAAAYASRVDLHLLGQGDVAGARRLLAMAPEPIRPYPDLYRLDLTCSVFEEDYPLVLAKLMPGRFRTPAEYLIMEIWVRDLLGMKESGTQAAGKHTAAVHAAADSLRTVLEGELARRAGVEDDAGEAILRGFLGYAQAALGNAEAAVREGDAAVRLAASAQDPILEAEMEYQRVLGYWMTGNRKDALDGLRALLAKPSWITAARLRVDPTFKGARDDPGFRKLLEGPEAS